MIAAVAIRRAHPMLCSSPRRAFLFRRDAWLSCLLTVAAMACGPRAAPRNVLERSDSSACLALLAQERDTDSIRQAALRSRAYFDRLPPHNSAAWGTRRISAADLRRGIDIALDVLGTKQVDWKRSFCNRLRLYSLRERTAGLLTGYYQPVLTARRRSTRNFQYPIYGLPKDLKNPYYTRRQIDGGALNGRADVLAWLNDPVDLFFLQIQGSGVLAFEDGSTMNVGYAASNGRPYRSIGKLLIEQGKLAAGQASMEGIKRYLRQHPEERDPILQTNERYIFFRSVSAGPIGSIGAILTPGHSIAADAGVYPAGAIGLLETSENKHSQPLPSRIVFIQDAGAAIKGPGRFDLFLGTGNEAGVVAGRLKAPARFYLLLPAGVL